MGNRYEITLDPAWAKWATEHGVSETIAAALFLLSRAEGNRTKLPTDSALNQE
jgi:hypothetical protein